MTDANLLALKDQLTAREKLALPAERMLRLMFAEAAEGLQIDPDFILNIEATPKEFKSKILFAYKGPSSPAAT